MKKVSLYLLAMAVTVSACQNHNVLTEAEKAAGWELLFDGATLDGWRDYNGTEVTGIWVVENGTLAALGQGADEYGYIVSDKQYENFELVFDWKISQGGNSGVFYHVVERPEVSVPYATGPEYQILDNVGFPEQLDDDQLAGADYGMYAPDLSKVRLKPVGQWNNSKIVFDNGHVEHWLNGEKVLEFEAWSEEWFELVNSGKWDDFPEYGLARRGVFSLQDHGDRVWYRNMKVRELPRKPKAAVDLFNGRDLHGWDVYGTELWYVENGLLICESGPDEEYGYLATRKYYNDFDLTVDFMQEADGNSGVFIRSYIKTGVEISGWQVEVAPPRTRNDVTLSQTGGIYESYGRGWIARVTPDKAGILKMGEWNTMRMLVKGDQVTTWLNGVEIVDLTDELVGMGQGRVALQIHDGGGIRVLWRNLKLQEL